MSCVKLYFHIVFATKKRQPIITSDKERELFSYIMRVTENKGGRLIRINAALNHIHILVSLPPTISVTDYVRDVKRSSSIYITQTGLYPKFWGWSKEYFASTVSEDVLDIVKQYIIGQKEHHSVKTFEEEWLGMIPLVARERFDMRYFDS